MSKLGTKIFLIHQNVPQIMSFHLRYIYDGFIGQKILKLWRQEIRPFGPGWAANKTRIHSWTFRLQWSGPIFLARYVVYCFQKSAKSPFDIRPEENCPQCSRTLVSGPVTLCTTAPCKYFPGVTVISHQVGINQCSSGQENLRRFAIAGDYHTAQ